MKQRIFAGRFAVMVSNPLPFNAFPYPARLKVDRIWLRMYYENIKEQLKLPPQRLRMIPAIPKVIRDFNALFTLICAKHTGPVVLGFGRQRVWGDLIAGQCSKNVQYIQAEGINAFLDIRNNKLFFSKGSEETLQELLSQAIGRARQKSVA
jgi:hypothetical protein